MYSTRATVVRVTLEPHAGGRIVGQVLGMRADDVGTVALDFTAVEIKVNHTPGEQSALGSGFIIPAATRILARGRAIGARSIRVHTGTGRDDD